MKLVFKKHKDSMVMSSFERLGAAVEAGMGSNTNEPSWYSICLPIIFFLQYLYDV